MVGGRGGRRGRGGGKWVCREELFGGGRGEGAKRREARKI